MLNKSYITWNQIVEPINETTLEPYLFDKCHIDLNLLRTTEPFVCSRPFCTRHQSGKDRDEKRIDH